YAKRSFDAAAVTGADTETEAAGSQSRDDLHLVRHDNRVSRPGRNDAGAHLRTLRTGGGRCEEGEAVRAVGAGGQPDSREAERFCFFDKTERRRDVATHGCEAEYSRHGPVSPQFI